MGTAGCLTRSTREGGLGFAPRSSSCSPRGEQAGSSPPRPLILTTSAAAPHPPPPLLFETAGLAPLPGRLLYAKVRPGMLGVGRQFSHWQTLNKLADSP